MDSRRIVSTPSGKSTRGPGRHAGVKFALITAMGAWSASAGLELFLLPNGLLIGGLNGLAALFAMHFQMPAGLLILLLNLPLCWKLYRGHLREYRHWALYGLVVFSAAAAVLYPVPALTKHPALAAVFGSFCYGAGIGLVFRAGGFLDGLGHSFAQSRSGDLAWKGIFAAVTLLILTWTGMTNGPETAMYSVVGILTAYGAIDFGQYGLSFARILRIESAAARRVAGVLERDCPYEAKVLAVMTDDGAASRFVMCRVNRRDVAGVSAFLRQHDPDCRISVMPLRL